jgi:predicted acetyltransferase
MSVDDRLEEIQSAPVDDRAAAKLAERGLELRIVDPADRDAVERYVQAETRGFYGQVMSPTSLEAHMAEFVAHRRLTAVYDPAGADPLTPIATSNSWIGPLTLPGEREIDAWAISGVTTAQTHRRRGIQRQIIEAELRTAHRLGVPIAMLTVSESSIYGRYGFGVAALAAEYRIDTRGLAWTGREVAGRLDFIPVTRWREQIPELFERVRLRDPAQTRPFALRWDQIAGIETAEGDKSGERLAVQYRDEAGEVCGLALYTIADDPAEFTNHRVSVAHVVAATDDAYAAIWRSFIEMDLVGTITYELGSPDEPFRWMVSNFRAVEVKPFDMQYLRVLDVPRVLEARAYEASGELSIEVVDDLGIAEGSWVLRTGSDPAVARNEGPADVVLGVADLSATVAGSATTAMLGANGHVLARRGSLDAVARLLGSSRPATLGFWY